MANRKRAIPQYGTVTLNGLDYYRTRVQDADGKLVALYARTPEELYDKELNALEQIDNDTFCRKSPTVAEYCEKWLLMQSVHVRATTMTDYTSKVRRHIAEKPSVAQTIAAALDVKNKKDEYMEGNGYLVSWCVGHLVQLAEAVAYGDQYKKWSYDSLPILPQE